MSRIDGLYVPRIKDMDNGWIIPLRRGGIISWKHNQPLPLDPPQVLDLTTNTTSNTLKLMSVGDTIKERFGEDHFKIIGARGGQAKVKKGFATDSDLAKWAGRKGGRASRRKK